MIGEPLTEDPAVYSAVLDPRHSAVLVIDVQNDFCSPTGAMAKVRGVDVSPVLQRIDNVNSLIAAARDAAVPVLWIREIFVPDRMTRHQKRMHCDQDGVWMLVPNTHGADWYEGLIERHPEEPVVTKWHYDAYSDTELDLMLRARAIETVVLAGFTTNVCVETTARHAAMKGYDVVVASDCTAAYDEEEHLAALNNIRRYFGFVQDRHAITAHWPIAGS